MFCWFATGGGGGEAGGVRVVFVGATVLLCGWSLGWPVAGLRLFCRARHGGGPGGGGGAGALATVVWGLGVRKRRVAAFS